MLTGLTRALLATQRLLAKSVLQSAIDRGFRRSSDGALVPTGHSHALPDRAAQVFVPDFALVAPGGLAVTSFDIDITATPELRRVGERPALSLTAGPSRRRAGDPRMVCRIAYRVRSAPPPAVVARIGSRLADEIRIVQPPV